MARRRRCLSRCWRASLTTRSMSSSSMLPTMVSLTKNTQKNKKQKHRHTQSFTWLITHATAHLLSAIADRATSRRANHETRSECNMTAERGKLGGLWRCHRGQLRWRALLAAQNRIDRYHWWYKRDVECFADTTIPFAYISAKKHQSVHDIRNRAPLPLLRLSIEMTDARLVGFGSTRTGSIGSIDEE